MAKKVRNRVLTEKIEHPSGGWTEVIEERGGYSYQQTHRLGYIVKVYDPDGNLYIEKSRVSDKSEATTYANQQIAKMDDRYGLLSKEEVAADEKLEKEKDEMKLELSKKTKTAEQALKDQAEISGEVTQRNISRQTSAQVAQVKNALLAQGYTAEEADAVVAKGVEAGARTTADVTSNIEMAKAKAVGDINQLDISNIKDAESLAAKLKEVSNTMILGKSNIANQLKMANISADASRYGADRSLEGTKYAANMQAVGDIAQSIGNVFPFRKGGKISKRLLEAYKENK